MGAADWKALGEALGWIELADHLFHAELDRVWPNGDWEGACRDLGLDEDDFAELCASQAA